MISTRGLGIFGPAMEKRNMLSVEDLTKTYGERTLFEGLTFGVQEGERVALVARNGAGTVSYTHLTLPTTVIV